MPVLLALALTARPAAPPPHPPDEVRQLVRRSIFEYDTGKYAKALADIERAYELDPLPALLFNVGQCLRALGRHREAAISFRSYLRDSPRAKNRAEVEALVAEMTRLAGLDEAGVKAAAKPVEPAAVRPAPVVAQPVAGAGRRMDQKLAVVPPAAVTPAPVVARPVAGAGRRMDQKLAAVPPAAVTPVVVDARPVGGAGRRMVQKLAAVPPAAVEARPARRGIRASAYWFGGGGLAAAIAGTVLYGLGGATLAGDHATTIGGLTEHELSRGAYTSAAAQETAGVIGWAAGGALLVAAGIVALTGSGR